jgi:hypothetical protein
MGAARDFQKEARKYADQSLMIGQPEAAYQDSINNIIESIKDISDTAKNWDYNTCAVEVIKWMNLRALQEQTVFNCMDTLAANGAARYTQDVPPGFLDRRKEDTLTRGSNRYGDLLFWQEVVQHARTISATSVIIVTRDRKGDWFAGAGEPIVEPDWQRVKAKWLPVPHPHPTLAFELKIKAGAELVLLDELYLGALLWKFGRPKFERLASVAIAVAPGHFERVAPPPRPVKLRAQKRLDQVAIGMNEANTLLKEAVGVPAERVTALLGQPHRGRAHGGRAA